MTGCDEARDRLQKAIELDPGLPDSWDSLGRLAFDHRRFADAEAAYARRSACTPSSLWPSRIWAATLLALRHWPDAVQALRHIAPRAERP